MATVESLVYLGNGHSLHTTVTLGLAGTGWVVVNGQEVVVARLASPYQYRDYGELVRITLLDGREVASTLRPYEYENHMAQVDVEVLDRAAVIHQNPSAIVISQPHVVSVIYDQAAGGQWRELSPSEQANLKEFVLRLWPGGSILSVEAAEEYARSCMGTRLNKDTDLADPSRPSHYYLLATRVKLLSRDPLQGEILGLGVLATEI